MCLISNCMCSRSCLSSAPSGSSISTSLRIEDEGARQRHPLLLAARELRRPARAELAELDHVQRLADALRDLRASASAGPDSGKADVLGHRHVREQRVVLEHHADVAPVRRQVARSTGRRGVISPEVGTSKPASIISDVVLPEPDGPEQGQELAPPMSRFRFLTTRVSPS